MWNQKFSFSVYHMPINYTLQSILWSSLEFIIVLKLQKLVKTVFFSSLKPRQLFAVDVKYPRIQKRQQFNRQELFSYSCQCLTIDKCRVLSKNKNNLYFVPTFPDSPGLQHSQNQHHLLSLPPNQCETRVKRIVTIQPAVYSLLAG